ncbi:MAG: stalk domain-containing protein [Minisyncoccia bacterium]
MLPIRFVAENLGYKVEWDQVEEKIIIIYLE